MGHSVCNSLTSEIQWGQCYLFFLKTPNRWSLCGPLWWPCSFAWDYFCSLLYLDSYKASASLPWSLSSGRNWRDQSLPCFQLFAGSGAQQRASCIMNCLWVVYLCPQRREGKGGRTSVLINSKNRSLLFFFSMDAPSLFSLGSFIFFPFISFLLFGGKILVLLETRNVR